MFRITTLASLSALALSGCIATPASAQFLYGNLHDDVGHTYSHHNHGHSYGLHHDLHHDYHHGHGNDYGYRHAAYPTTVLSPHYSIPVYAGTDCPYGNDAVCSEPIGYPLQRGRALQNQFNDTYQPGFGLDESGHNHSHGDNNHSGHSHDGHSHDPHSHDGHSHDSQIPGGSFAPSDRGYLAPPSLPRGSTYEAPRQQDFGRQQPRQDDSIRMDSPPPASFGPSSPSSAPSSGDSPKRFDTPPPSTL